MVSFGSNVPSGEELDSCWCIFLIDKTEWDLSDMSLGWDIPCVNDILVSRVIQENTNIKNDAYRY